MSWSLKEWSLSRRAALLTLAMVAVGFVPLAAAAPQEADTILLVAASDGEALFERGQQLYDAKQYGAALPILLDAARHGHPGAQRLLGHMYGSGLGVRQDFAQAMQWYRQAADRGDRSAQWSLGLGYMRGLGGLPVDQRMAAQLFQRAAEQGFAYAQGDLGLAYEFGEGVPRNRQTALHWLDLAAAQGYGRAHWYADWLRRADTPQFQTVAQLDGYINAQVTAANGLGRRSGVAPPPGQVWNGQSYGPANPVTGAPCHASLHNC